MAKRVGIVIAGLGARDGSDVLDTMTVALGLLRSGAEPLLLVPPVTSSRVVDHQTGEVLPDQPPRVAAQEAARLGLGAARILDGSETSLLDALYVPGGEGVSFILSNYAEKGAVCDVQPALAQLLRETFKARLPLAFAGSAALLAARVLGPVAGVRVTLGHRGTQADKLAAVMGADVRPCLAQDLVVDQKHAIVSTPSALVADASLKQRFQGLDRLTKTLLGLSRQPSPAPGATPAPRQPAAGTAGPAVRANANGAPNSAGQAPNRAAGDVVVRRRLPGQGPART
jgi:enhancing lycopene biosynthesis protein 2